MVDFYLYREYIRINVICFDKCFLGMNGIDLELGFTTPDPEEAILKNTAIELSEEAYILADNSKFSETFFSKVADVSEATIITNQLDDDLLIKFRDKTNMKVVTS